MGNVSPVERIQNLLNQLSFGARSRLRWRREGYGEPAESKADLWQDRPDEAQLCAREEKLIRDYGLESFVQVGSRIRYMETLTYLAFLECLSAGDLLPRPSAGPLRWLDVGAKNWTYVLALYRLIERQVADFSLLGIELDAYRVYWNLYSRFDYAESYIRDLPKARYLAGDVLTHPETSVADSFDVVSCFLPFVFPEPCLAWGLPRDCFQPLDFLRHLVSLVRPGGWLLVVNQDVEEYEEQQRLFQLLDPEGGMLALKPLGRLPDTFTPYRFPRYGWQCRKILS